jgi:hypothetical protein
MFLNLVGEFIWPEAKKLYCFFAIYHTNGVWEENIHQISSFIMNIAPVKVPQIAQYYVSGKNIPPHVKLSLQMLSFLLTHHELASCSATFCNV